MHTFCSLKPHTKERRNKRGFVLSLPESCLLLIVREGTAREDGLPWTVHPLLCTTNSTSQKSFPVHKGAKSAVLLESDNVLRLAAKSATLTTMYHCVSHLAFACTIHNSHAFATYYVLYCLSQCYCNSSYFDYAHAVRCHVPISKY